MPRPLDNSRGNRAGYTSDALGDLEFGAAFIGGANEDQQRRGRAPLRVGQPRIPRAERTFARYIHEMGV